MTRARASLELTPADWQLFVSTSDASELQAAADDLNASAMRALRQDDHRDAWAIFRSAGERHREVGAFDSEPEWVFNEFMLKRFGPAGHRFGEDFLQQTAEDARRVTVRITPRPAGPPLKLVKIDRATTGADWVVIRDDDTRTPEQVAEGLVEARRDTGAGATPNFVGRAQPRWRPGSRPRGSGPGT